MVTTHFLLLVFLAFLSFTLGRVSGRIEASLLFSMKINSIIGALKKVETLAALKGEDLSKLSTEEIVYRTQKQMEIKDDDQ